VAESKHCRKCGTTKPLEDFHVQRRNKTDGRQSRCKDCQNATTRKRYNENRDNVLARQKDYRAENAEVIAARSKKYREENREQELARQKNYRENNKEAIAACGAKWYAENKERRAEAGAKWYAENREAANARREALRWEGREDQRDMCYLARPHEGYIWYWPDDSVAYVGITQRGLALRTSEHMRESEWVAEGAIPPESAAAEFETGWDGQKWERAQIEAAIARGDDIRNISLRPLN
jgi:hypothetical protein